MINRKNQSRFTFLIEYWVTLILIQKSNFAQGQVFPQLFKSPQIELTPNLDFSIHDD